MATEEKNGKGNEVGAVSLQCMKLAIVWQNFGQKCQAFNLIANAQKN